MKKYTFSTDFDKVCENLGVSNERHDFFFKAAKSISMRAIFFDKEITERSQAMELFLNEVLPDSMVEAFWAGCVFSNVFSQSEKIAERMAKQLT